MGILKKKAKEQTMKHSRLPLSLCVLLMTASIFSPPPSFAKESVIQIKGSDTMVNLGQAWAEEFMAEHSEVSIAVTGGGSGTGISALVSGTTTLAQS